MRGLAAPLVKLIVFAVVTILATGLLAATIANLGGGGGTKFNAIFSDVTSLNEGDEVRIAGVRVGQVEKIAIHDDREAEVQSRCRNGTGCPPAPPRPSASGTSWGSATSRSNRARGSRE